MKKFIRFLTIILMLFIFVGCGDNTNQEKPEEKKDEPDTRDLITITYDMNGGEEVAAVKQERNTLATFPLPKREGYTFVTWVVNGYEFDTTQILTEDTTLKAIWIKEVDEFAEVVVYFNTDGGSYIEPMVLEIGDKIVEPDAPEKEGYTFKYWVDEYSNKKFNFNTEIEEEMYLSALYEEKKKVSVKFDTDGGEPIESTFVYYGESLGTLPTPTKEGYLFIAWYYNGKEVDGTLIPSVAITLRAKFAEIGDGYKYVTFKNDDGTVIEKQKVEMGKAAIAPTATKTGYTFTNWDRDFSFIYEDIEVNAVFTINIYTVTVKDNVFWQLDTTYEVPYMGSIEAPVLEDKGEKIFAGWDKPLDNITDNIVILAVWKDRENATDEDKIEHTINLLNKYYNECDNKTIELCEGEEDLGTSVVWQTSNSTVINLDGVITLQFERQNVTLTAKVQCGSVDKTVVFEFHLPRINMDLSDGVAAAYLFSDFTGDKNLLYSTFDVYYLAFATFNSNGDVTGLGSMGSDFVLEGLETIHKRGAYAVPSFRTTETFAAVAKNKAACDNFATQIVEMINKYDLDGVDIDWEYPKDKAEQEGYVYMMKVIYEKVKANNPSHIVTSAILLGAVSRFSLGTTIKTMDYLNLMTYELHTHIKTTHHTPLYPSSKGGTSYAISSSVAEVRNAGVPYNKMIIGAGFFGRQYTGTPGLGSLTTTYIDDSISYKSIVSKYLMNQTETCKRYWDNECKVPYIYDSETGLFITYDDSESIYYKADYVKKNKLAGLMCWQTGQDNGDLIQSFVDNYNLIKKK